ncbi:MAG: 50S ribosomal protein L25 [Candidatus Hydrogenedentes bacterium]|nr:50S ribosomal protein L25 [Candidatus Hydrogenedentota bacterium]
MELQNLSVSVRQGGGKGAARRTRAQGKVPGVLYGGTGGSVPLLVERRSFEHVVHGRYGEHAVVQLEVTEEPALSTPALLKEVQHDPISGVIVHADFMRIRLDERIQTVTAIQLVGQARGVVDGGVLDQQMRELEIECLALETPERIVADVSDLGIGHSLTVAQLVVPEGVTVLAEPDRPVATVHPPRVLEVEAPAAEGVEGEGAKEPEVVGGKAEKTEDKDKEKEKDKS